MKDAWLLKHFMEHLRITKKYGKTLMKTCNIIEKAEKINSFIENFINELPCDMSDPQDFCMNSILDMLRGTGITITKLIKNECVKDSLILLRTQIERFIKLKKICDESEYALIFICETERQRLKYIEIAMSNGDEVRNNPHYEALRKVLKKEDYEKLKESVSKQEKEKNIWELAKETGLLIDYYSTGYRFYSEPAHCSPSQLDDCLTEVNGQIILVPYEKQSLGELLTALMLSCHLLLEGISIVSQIKKIDVKSQIDNLRILDEAKVA